MRALSEAVSSRLYFVSDKHIALRRRAQFVSWTLARDILPPQVNVVAHDVLP